MGKKDEAVLPSFAERLLGWFDHSGRHDLPWQQGQPYPVWVSEIMLQQTQVKTVLGYFERFMQRFPSVEALGAARWEEVAPYWAGLGYYARARNLHRAAQQVAQAGTFPQTLSQWMALPGIGRSTAGAILALGQGQHGVIMDGNVRRVLCRYLALAADPLSPAMQRQLWDWAERLTPTQRTADYAQAMMDLGATVCTPRKPLCLYCPLSADCAAHRAGRELEFPTKKIRAPVPRRQSWALQIRQGECWLWEQRPDQGIWGGLMCWPLLDADSPAPDGFAGAQIEHTLTHLRWKLTTWTCEGDIQGLVSALKAQGRVLHWLTLDQARARGWPTAMDKLLQAEGLQ